MVQQQSTAVRPPIDYEVVGEDRKLNINWKNYFNQLWLFFNYNFKGNVPIMPSYTTSGMNAIDNPQDGMVIYNTDTHKFMGRENGSWMTFTTS